MEWSNNYFYFHPPHSFRGTIGHWLSGIYIKNEVWGKWVLMVDHEDGLVTIRGGLLVDRIR
jgi:hypothetical protein